MRILILAAMALLSYPALAQQLPLSFDQSTWHVTAPRRGIDVSGDEASTDRLGCEKQVLIEVVALETSGATRWAKNLSSVGCQPASYVTHSDVRYLVHQAVNGSESTHNVLLQTGFLITAVRSPGVPPADASFDVIVTSNSLPPGSPPDRVYEVAPQVVSSGALVRVSHATGAQQPTVATAVV